jgi:two-component system sensor histidine kinase PilS (NtrC family)
MHPEGELRERLQKLTLLRLVFSALLLGSTLFLEVSREDPPTTAARFILYGLIGFIFCASLAYTLAIGRVARVRRLALAQILADTLIVTLILLATGGYSSPFSFLYLVVIVYSSLLLGRRGTVMIAALCIIQFGIMVDLEYFGLLNPFQSAGNRMSSIPGWDDAITKIATIMAGCIIVAFLSSFLSDQLLRTRRELHLMEAHVKRVEKMAAVGEMAARLAHEIKNPLASLSGAIQMLREDTRFDPDHDRLMRIILREADRLSSLSSNFLLYARPPAGKIQPVEVEKALRETVELFGKRGANGKRVTTTLVAQPGIWVAMDPAHLQQVLWNLLVNAAEAIEDSGQIRIELSTLRDRQVCLQVADTGAGMSAETIKFIFDPFFTTKACGTGLGLPIVHRILEAYQGRIDVYSEPDQGATFRIYLRQINLPADPAAARQLLLDRPRQFS